MASLHIEESDIPMQNGKVAIITGGSSGIGLAAAVLLAKKGAKVHILDINPLGDDIENVQHRCCNIANWEELRTAFEEIGHVDYVFANAGVSEETDYFADHTDSNGQLVEPSYRVIDVNLRAVYNVVKLAWSQMRKQDRQTPYSVVITTSASGYAPEQSLPVYSSGKLALVGLIRALRSVMIRDGITINGVAPAATITNLLPAHLAAPIIAQGLPVSNADFVGLALVYSAVGMQDRRVQMYGKDKDAHMWNRERWNGRVILTLGKSYTELEEPTADLRPFWFGRENAALTRQQQAATDFRRVE
ncbi:short chain dehydrogenase reductase [Xylariaceae sp. AK1471]|nr:short chain dehydrogenase reductase [Xylariaceae sp. AK1471]